jgi:hypothetical protein
MQQHPLRPGEPEERREPTEEEIAAFGRWYEAQPREWVDFLDGLGKTGPRTPSAR